MWLRQWFYVDLSGFVFILDYEIQVTGPMHREVANCCRYDFLLKTFDMRNLVENYIMTPILDDQLFER